MELARTEPLTVHKIELELTVASDGYIFEEKIMAMRVFDWRYVRELCKASRYLASQLLRTTLKYGGPFKDLHIVACGHVGIN